MPEHHLEKFLPPLSIPHSCSSWVTPNHVRNQSCKPSWQCLVCCGGCALKKPKSFGETGSSGVSYCDPFAGVAAFSTFSLQVAAHSSCGMKIWHLGMSAPSSRVGKFRALGFYPNDQCIWGEGDLPWRKSSMALLNNPYNLPQNKIIVEELGVYNNSQLA